MRRRPVTATWWLLTDADGERYLQHVPRDPWAPASTRGWRNPNAQPIHVALRRRGDDWPLIEWRIIPRPIGHRERVRFGAWNVAGLVRVREHVCGERVGKDRHPCTLWTRHHGPHQAWEPPKPCVGRWVRWADGDGEEYIPLRAPQAAPGAPNTPAPVSVEGPADSGGSESYKCHHCGRALGSFEAGIAFVGTAPVCHPNDDGVDCYRRVTVYGEKLGARR